MVVDRKLPTRSPASRIARRLGGIPHGLPTAVTFSGATAAVVASAVVGAAAVVLPGRLHLVHPRDIGVPKTPPQPTQGDGETAVDSALANPATVRSISAITGAGSPKGPSAPGSVGSGPGPTPQPGDRGTPEPTEPAPSPTPGGADDGRHDGAGWPSPTPEATAEPAETAEPPETSGPAATSRPSRSPRPTPTPTPHPTWSPRPTPGGGDPTPSPTPHDD